MGHKQISDSELSISGYVLFRVDRQGGEATRGGGVMLYVKECFSPVEFRPRSEFPEHVWCRVLDDRGRELLVGVCYRTTSEGIFGCDENEMLRSLMRELRSRCVLLMGDFNYGGVEWGEVGESRGASAEGVRFKECLEENFYVQHVGESTRGDRILDLVISNEPELIGELEILDCLSSGDHNMIRWNAYFGSGGNEHGRRRFDYRKADFDQMRKELSGMDWDEFLGGNTNDSWVKFRNLLHELEKRYVPVKEDSKGKWRKRSLWITQKAMRAVENKRKVYAKHKDRTHPAYIAANKKMKAETREAKVNFESKLAGNIKYDSKSFFAYVRSKSKARTQLGVLVGEDGTVLETDEKVALEFNRYFSSVFGGEEVGDIPDVENAGARKGVSVNELEITFEKVRGVLRKLRADKSPGVDDMSPRILMHVQEEICSPLVILFTKSLEEGCVPDDWKRANIVPIFKSGCRNRAENYRPVSLTSQVCKVFETLIRDKIVEHMENNALLNVTQHGFRKGRSCLTNLLSFLERVTEGLDRKEGIDVIFLDFAKAFDKVPHKRLLRKVESFGIGGKLLEWIRDWLSNRWQRVGYKGSWSEWRRVLSGIPQGSVLGPLLFLIFVDDLDEGLTSMILKFADDTKILGTVNCWEDRNRLQKDLDRLVDWADKWQMKFNVGKCKVMHLGGGNEGWNYVMDHQRLKVVREEKDLGVRLTSDMKVSTQCTAAYAKANRMLGLISRTFESRSELMMKQLYRSLVRPHLEYCTAAWSPHYTKDKDLLERVQHRFTRMIPGMRELGYEERLRRLGLMTLEERRNRSDLVEMFKISKKLSAISLETFFELDTSGRTRGHRYKIKKQCSSSDLRKFFFSQRVVDKWNALEEEVVEAESVNMFKARLERNRTRKMGLLTDH